MNYEEKLKNIINSTYTPFADINTLLKYFPELEESKDTKIRNAIISGMRALKAQHKIYFASIPIDDVLTWLEEQGNQREQLINKACNIVANCIEDYRMETWSEECKKQTIENIRKKLEE